MEIIEKLQHNFQNIVDDLVPDYEVVIRQKSIFIIEKYYYGTLFRFNLSEKEFKSVNKNYVKYRAFLAIYLNQNKGIPNQRIAKYLKTSRQSISYLIKTYTDNFIEKKLLGEYKHFRTVMDNI